MAEMLVGRMSLKYQDKKTGDIKDEGKTKPEVIMRQLSTKPGQACFLLHCAGFLLHYAFDTVMHTSCSVTHVTACYALLEVFSAAVCMIISSLNIVWSFMHLLPKAPAPKIHQAQTTPPSPPPSPLRFQYCNPPSPFQTPHHPQIVTYCFLLWGIATMACHTLFPAPGYSNNGLSNPVYLCRCTACSKLIETLMLCIAWAYLMMSRFCHNRQKTALWRLPS